MSCERCRKAHTREEWDELWWSWYRLQLRRGVGAAKAFRAAHREMEKHGPRPPAPPKPPLKIQVGLWVVKKKLEGLPSVEVPMLWKKLVVALVFGIGAAGPVLSAALSDGAISGQEWGGLLSAFIAAFWGKFSSNTTVVAPSRKGETVHGPA
jgi:hypothetical protein